MSSLVPFEGLWVPEPFVDSQYHPTEKWLLQSDEESDKCAVVPFSGLWVPEPFVGSQHHLTGKWLLQSDEESDRCAIVPLSVDTILLSQKQSGPDP
uniref:Uncharacterized protein n=1 Tax=Sphaerodactylus townsendi TaxID=933632 RepID=A0ACB8EFB8_9SAUR